MGRIEVTPNAQNVIPGVVRAHDRTARSLVGDRRGSQTGSACARQTSRESEDVDRVHVK